MDQAQDAKQADEAPNGMATYTNPEEAKRLGYGPDRPPYFSTAFLVHVRRDPKTGGMGAISFQTQNLDESLRKAKEEMGVERVASREEVEMLVARLHREFEREAQAKETGREVSLAMQVLDAKAQEAIANAIGKKGI